MEMTIYSHHVTKANNFVTDYSSADEDESSADEDERSVDEVEIPTCLSSGMEMTIYSPHVIKADNLVIDYSSANENESSVDEDESSVDEVDSSSYIPFCHDIFRFQPNFTLGVLKDSSTKGCAKCSLLWKAAVTFTPKQSHQQSRVISFTNSSCLDTSFHVTLFNVDNAGSGYMQRHIELFSVEGDAYKLADMVINPTPLLRGNTSTPEVWSIAREWLSKCIELHSSPACHSNAGYTRLPTRVLDLGSNADVSCNVRLRETQGEEFGNYVCLSHCWGTRGDTLKTTCKTLEAHKDHILFDVLPKTFQDAVVFARWLGVQYLWIDSLCILQDSKSDWERESGAMATIYEQAYLTLSAAKAHSASDGLFMDRDCEDDQQEFIHERGALRSPIRVYMREKMPHSPIDGDYRERVAHPSFPLLSRAWVFQERILSPRVLHFGSQELYWECRQTRQCECGHKSIAAPWGKRDFESMMIESPSSPTKSFQLDRITGWKSLVQKYSELHLTFAEDRLPAISGLAKRMGSRMPDAQYLAGLWSNDTAALIWRIDGAPALQPSHSCYIGPSWSWVSVNRPIRYIPSPDTIYYELVDASCVATGEDPTGRVSKGHLSIKGQLESATYDGSTMTWKFPEATLAWNYRDAMTFWDTIESEHDKSRLHLLRLCDIAVSVFFLILGHVDTEESAQHTTHRRLGIIQASNTMVDGAHKDTLASHSLFNDTTDFTII
ncbi:heterokaryon incompatibility protein-domain-containing protein [Massariosphaeria phaeospora]|uniref:Heterokaryon incompatibility protein-domain-containing protein n=1 Tax=Massariosphaeria phaeospora TaxID=100035 RepID=A0A7C8I6P5_9PLEO|nr:heterokaryon incompatibility protein-domain-containing protein [Massariosphaeria phaeospora]